MDVGIICSEFYTAWRHIRFASIKDVASSTSTSVPIGSSYPKFISNHKIEKKDAKNEVDIGKLVFKIEYSSLDILKFSTT